MSWLGRRWLHCHHRLISYFNANLVQFFRKNKEPWWYLIKLDGISIGCKTAKLWDSCQQFYHPTRPNRLQSSFSEGRKTFKPADFYGAKKLKGVCMLSGERSIYARFLPQIPSKISFTAFFEKNFRSPRGPKGYARPLETQPDYWFFWGLGASSELVFGTYAHKKLTSPTFLTLFFQKITKSVPFSVNFHVFPQANGQPTLHTGKY